MARQPRPPLQWKTSPTSPLSQIAQQACTLADCCGVWLPTPDSHMPHARALRSAEVFGLEAVVGRAPQQHAVAGGRPSAHQNARRSARLRAGTWLLRVWGVSPSAAKGPCPEPEPAEPDVAAGLEAPPSNKIMLPCRLFCSKLFRARMHAEAGKICLLNAMHANSHSFFKFLACAGGACRVARKRIAACTSKTRHCSPQTMPNNLPLNTYPHEPSDTCV